MAKRALVFAGGPFSQYTFQLASAQNPDIAQADVWCADSGLVHALSCHLTPKVVVGDCDSVPPEVLDGAVSGGVELIRHPANKNASDLELTFRELTAAAYTEVTLLAVSGGRTDHSLFNWMLALQQDWPFQLLVVDESISAYLIHSQVAFNANLKPNTVVSLLPRDSVSGVRTEGLQYPLNDARLMGGSTLGLSNLVAETDTAQETRVRVSVASGRLLVCVVHNDS